MAINERLIDTEAAAAAVDTENNLILHLDASDVDSYDGDGDEWIDIKDHEYKPTTNVAQNFNTVIYDGQAADLSVTGVGFTPDLVWIKCRDVAVTSHTLVDSVRGGDGTRMYSIFSDLPNIESTFNAVETIDLDGFTVFGDKSATNRATQEYVAWCFKAGGAAVLNEEGDEDSYVSANNDLGFSIVKGDSTATGSDVKTVGHGLDSAPELVIMKNRNDQDSWWVYSSTTGVSKYLKLDSTVGTTTWFQNMVVNSTEIGVRTDSTGTWSNMIAYCFTSKRGVSKVGSYTGDGSTSNKVYTGFEPAFVLQKRTDNTSNWRIFDNVRGTEKELYANANDAEPSDVAYIDFNRDGFTLTNSGAWINGNTEKYIYYAVAKNTNETSLIAPGTNLQIHLDAASFPEKGETGYSNAPTTWTDSSSNSNDGTISGGATFDSELGNWLDFSNDNVTIPSTATSPIEASARNFTLSMWINRDSTGYDPLITKYGTSSSTRSWYFGINTSSQLQFGWFNGSANVYSIATSAIVNTTNQWYHVALSVNATTMDFYVDGVLKDSLTGSFTHKSGNNEPITIGSQASGAWNWFDGKIGQVRAYSTALSASEIRQNYNFTKPSYPNGYDAALGTGTTKPTFVPAAGGEVDHFSFDGSNDSVDLDRSIGSSVWTNNWTASTWIKFDTTTPANQCIFTSHDIMYNYLYTNNNTQLRFSNDAGCTFSTASNSIAANNWYHIVVTKSSTVGAVIYINGVSSGTSSNNSNSAASSGSGGKPALGIYNSNGTNNYPLDGKIASHKFFNTVLTGSEVSAQFDAEKSHYGL